MELPLFVIVRVSDLTLSCNEKQQQVWTAIKSSRWTHPNFPPFDIAVSSGYMPSSV